jgi:hypothetical protein
VFIGMVLNRVSGEMGRLEKATKKRRGGKRELVK